MFYEKLKTYIRISVSYTRYFGVCIKKREKVILGRIYEKFKTYIRYFKVSIDKQEKNL